MRRNSRLQPRIAVPSWVIFARVMVMLIGAKGLLSLFSGAEFSAVSPWDGSFSFTAPAAATPLANFTNSLLITYSGNVSGFSSSRFSHHQIFMTSSGTSTGTVRAKPGNLHSFGQDFGVFLEP